MRIAICDDTTMEADFLRDMLGMYQTARAHVPMEIELFQSAEELIEALGRGECFDLFFLDIIMPGMDGMSLAKALRKDEGHCAIVFLTSSTDFAVEAFAVRAMDYLVKPVRKDRMFETMDNVLDALADRVEAVETIPTPDYELHVLRRDILSVEVAGHTLIYRLTGGRTAISKVLRISFEQATAALAADPRFLYSHRSYLINLTHVHKLDRDGFLLDDGSRVPVSRLRVGDIKKAYAAFLANWSAK